MFLRKINSSLLTSSIVRAVSSTGYLSRGLGQSSVILHARHHHSRSIPGLSPFLANLFRKNQYGDDCMGGALRYSSSKELVEFLEENKEMLNNNKLVRKHICSLNELMMATSKYGLLVKYINVKYLQDLITTADELIKLIELCDLPKRIAFSENLFAKLGPEYLDKLIKSVDDLIQLPQTIIAHILPETLRSIIKNKEDLIKLKYWSFQANYDIHRGARYPEWDSYKISKLLSEKLGKDFISSFFKNAEDVLPLLADRTMLFWKLEKSAQEELLESFASKYNHTTRP